MTETTKEAPAKAEGTKARVLKNGDGKISKGVRVSGARQFYKKGDEITLPDATALSLEDRGYVEIL